MKQITALLSIGCLGLMFAASTCFAQTITTFDMPNSTFTQPAAINAAGQITGAFRDTSFKQHGFLRQPDGTSVSFDAPYPFPTFGPAVQTGATSINAAGQITGFVIHPTDLSFGFLRETDGTFLVFGHDCFQTTVDTFTALAVPPGPIQNEAEGTVPTAINNRGQIIGECNFASHFGFGFLRQPDGEFDAFAPQDACLGIPQIEALAINSRGQITGFYLKEPCATFIYSGFLREPDGTFTSFDAPSSTGQRTIPTAINNRGQIAGYTDHGFLRHPDGSIVIFDVPNAVSTQPTAIDPEGDITGVYLDSSSLSHGFFRDKDGTITAFDVPNAISTYPTGMNTDGDITGWYSDAGGVHGFVRFR